MKLGGKYMKKTDDSQTKSGIIVRLSRLEGQVRGVKQMIENDRECDDILIQISAIINSLKSLGNNLLKEHIETKIADNLKNGDLDSIDEVITLFSRIN